MPGEDYFSLSSLSLPVALNLEVGLGAVPAFHVDKKFILLIFHECSFPGNIKNIQS